MSIDHLLEAGIIGPEPMWTTSALVKGAHANYHIIIILINRHYPELGTGAGAGASVL
jgi:hypothetical protein